MQKWSITSPALGVFVSDLSGEKECIPLPEISFYDVICFLDEHSLVFTGFRGEVSFEIDRRDLLQVVLLSDLVILLSVSRSGVNQSCASLEIDVPFGKNYLSCDFFLCRNLILQRMFIFLALQFASFDCSNDTIIFFIIAELLHYVLNKFGSHPDLSAVELDQRVIVFRMNHYRDVRRYCPWCCSPDHELLVGVLQRHRYVDLRILLVGVLHFIVGDCCLTSCAHVNRIGVLVKESLLVCLLECLPGTFYVVVVEGKVRVLPVHPDSHILEVVVHVVDVFRGVVLALLHEVLYSEILYILFGGEALLFLHLVLYRKSVGVITGLCVDVVAVHPVITDEVVLEYLSHRGPHMHRSCGVGRTVKEVENLITLVPLQGSSSGIVFLPALLDFFLYIFRNVVSHTVESDVES